VDPTETVDGRSVEMETLFQGRLELCRRDRDGLELTEDVGEPESDEFHTSFLDSVQHVVILWIHTKSVTSVSRGRHLRRLVSHSVHIPPL
jgi:hypothetical protein